MDADVRRPWWRGVLESAILLALLTLAGWAVGARPGFEGVSPNPYVIAVCLMAFRYGLRDGVLAGGQAVVWLIVFRAAPLLGSGSAVVTRAFLWDVLVLGGAGLLVGYLADEHLSREAALRGQVKSLDQDLAGMRERVASLEEANRELVKRVTSETHTIGSLYAMAEKLSVLDPKDLYPGILDLVAEYLGAEKCTLYLLQGDHLAAAGHRGWEGPPAERPTGSIQDPVMGRVVTERVTLSLRDLAIAGISPPDAWAMATPIVDPEKDTVIGALVVEQIPFQGLSRSNVRVLSVIGKWAGMAIRQAYTYSTAVSEKARADAAMNRLLDGLKTRPGSHHAIPALIEMGEPVIPFLAEVLHTGTSPQRFYALKALEALRAAGHAPPPEAVRRLVADELARLVHLLKLSAPLQGTDDPAFEALRWALEEERARSVDTLLLAEALQGRLALTAAVGEWRSQNPRLRERALAAMRSSEPTPPIQVVLRLSEGGPSAALAAHPGAGSPPSRAEAVPVAILRDDEDPWLLAGALYAAAGCDDPDVLRLVLARTDHPDALVRENALAALAKLVTRVADERATARLTQALTDPLPSIRALAASSLAAISAGTGKSTLTLTILSGPFQGRQQRFEKFPIVLGREPECDLVLLHDEAVSRKHARVFLEARGFVLEDLGSRNGTFLDNVRLKAPVTLLSPRAIRLGRTLVHFAPASPAGVRAPGPADMRPAHPEVAAVLAAGLADPSGIAARDGAPALERLRRAVRGHARIIAAEQWMSSLLERTDGCLVTFPTLRGALVAARRILREKPEGLPRAADGSLPSLRVAVHVGDRDPETARREAGPLAQALEEAGLAGFHACVEGVAREAVPLDDRILLSGEAYANCGTASDFSCRLLGDFDLPGFPGRQRVYELLWRPG